MNNSISQQVIISIYRILSIVLVLLPVLLNIIMSGDLVTSLIYSPMLSLFLAFSLVSLDNKLTVLLARLASSKTRIVNISSFYQEKQKTRTFSCIS